MTSAGEIDIEYGIYSLTGACEIDMEATVRYLKDITILIFLYLITMLLFKC